MRLDNYCPNISMETIFMKTENSKLNEPQRSSNKHIAFQNLSVCSTWKNLRQQYKNNKMMWNDEFELPDD